MTTNDDTPNTPDHTWLAKRLAVRKEILEQLGDAGITGFASSIQVSEEFLNAYRVEKVVYMTETAAKLVVRTFKVAEIFRDQVNPWVRKMDKLRNRVRGLKERNAAAYLGDHIERDRFKTNVNEITKWERAFEQFDQANRVDLMIASNWYEHTVRIRSSCAVTVGRYMELWANNDKQSADRAIMSLVEDTETFDLSESKYFEAAARIKARFADLEAFEAEEKLDRGVEMGGDPDILAYKNAGK